MERQHILLLISLPIIAFAGWLLWKEYDEFYGKPPVDLPKVSQTAPATSTNAPAATSPVSSERGKAVEEVPSGRTAEQAAIIARAKKTPVSFLDSSLPHQSASEWMERTAGAPARIAWEVNDCGDVAKQPGTIPVCAQANIDFSDGTKFQALLLMGTRAPRSHGVEFADPSLMWAAYSKSDGDALTPAPLSALTRIAQSAN